MRKTGLIVALLLSTGPSGPLLAQRSPTLPGRRLPTLRGKPLAKPAAAPAVKPPSKAAEGKKQDDEAEARAAKRRRAMRRGKGKLKLDFDRADIVEVVKAISDMTGRNFILPDNIRGKITILSPTAVSPDEAYNAFLAALEANNLAVYPVGKFLKILPKKDGQRVNIPTITDPDGYVPWNEQLVTRLFRLKHVEADQVTSILKALVSRDGEVQVFPPDLLIITDVGLNIRRMEKILKQIDQPGGADEMRIIQVKYAAASDLASMLMDIFEGGNNARRGSTVTQRRGRRPGGAKKPDGEELSVSISRVIADERTNKLIVIADEKSFRRIQELIDQLDVPTEGEGQVHVHYLTNADAEELASTLSQLASGSNSNRRTVARPRAGRGESTEATAAELFSGEMKITADKSTNSLVIVSSYNDYKALRRVIEKLDIPRKQVFVEAVIMEVSLDTSDELGLSFHGGAAPEIEGSAAPVILGTQLGGLNSLSLASLLSLGGFLAGIQGPAVPGTENLPVSVPSFGVVLQALQRDSRVNVLSTPHILTSDNEEAEITVGQNVPFQAGFAPPGLQNLISGSATQQNQTNPLLGSFAGALGGLGSFFAPIQRQNVELKLKIEPQINESDFVRLAIEEQTEEIASQDPQLGPTTSRRTAKTTVVARDGQTVVIGGLIQERTLESVQKVPFFGDIPVIGWLFRNTQTKTIKTNLLLFLTPYIINGPEDFRRIFERKLEERRQFVEQFYGIAGDYDPVDYARKRGPLAVVHKTIEKEEALPENGGRGSGVHIITPEPQGAADEPGIESSDSEAHETQAPASETGGGAEKGSGVEEGRGPQSPNEAKTNDDS
ncbi:MAG: type II secretion system protein GspD [Deltaproteobacteria bacterium]|nr:MAG: type II secretion system protein GspD [Deltaproteobacteria bacterium]